MKLLNTVSFAALLVLLTASAASAHPAAEKRAAPKPNAPRVEKKSKQQSKAEKKKDRYLAIVGGVVHTISGATIDGATILCKNGKIDTIGRDVTVPKDAKTLDAAGHHVYPGLIGLQSSGLMGFGNPETSANVYSLPLTLGLAGGLTTTVTRNSAVKLTHGTLDGMILKSGLFESIAYNRSNPTARRSFRMALERIRQHFRDVEEFERKKARGDKDAKKPDDRWIRGQYQKASRLLKGEATAWIETHESSEIAAISGLARQYKFKVVIDGAIESWAVAPEMARADVAAIVTPRVTLEPDRRTNRPTGSSIENARILYERGVPFGIVPRMQFISTSGLAGRDLLHLPMEAAFAVRGGLPEHAAIEAITLQAARILDLDHRIGSIEVGKDADFAITDGPLLHYLTHVRWTVVNGRIAYDKTKESLFDHIRPGGNADAPPPSDHWPRSLGEDW